MSAWTSEPPTKRGWYWMKWDKAKEPTIELWHGQSMSLSGLTFGPRIPSPAELVALVKCAEAAEAVLARIKFIAELFSEGEDMLLEDTLSALASAREVT